MTDFRAEFKSRRFGFGNVDEIRAIRADTVDVKRKSRRTKYFDEQRNFDSLEAPTPVKQPQRLVDSRRERLLKWKKERDLRNKLKKEQAKPVFKTGIVHHKFYSPLFSQPKPTEKTPRKEPIPKRITRATEKRLAAKAAAAAITEQSKKSSQKKIPNQKKVGKKSFAPEGYKFKAPAGLLQLPLIGTVTPKKRCSGTTEWFVFDEKNSPKEAVDENNRKESEIVRFGRASVQKTRFRNFSIFDLSTPAAKKDVIDDNPKTRSILMTTSKYDGNKNQNGNRIEEDDEEDEKQHSRPRKVKPKVERTPKNKAVHFTPGTKTPKSPSQKKIKIVRVKL